MKPGKSIDSLILTVRGQRVIIDRDLAGLYGVLTKALNQAIKRNTDRFPEDFMFQLTPEEWNNLRSQFVTSSSASHGGRRTRPDAFTEHRAIMAANVINSAEAVAMSVFVVRAFVRMREHLVANAAILKRLAEIDRHLLKHDQALSVIWLQLQPLLAPPPPPPPPPKRRIGFQP